MPRISVIIAASLLATGMALAQTAPQSVPTAPAVDQPRAVNEATATATRQQGQSGEGACVAAETTAQPATQPQPGAGGSDASNAGSTGWTGGTGGSQIGTNAQGAVPTSPTWQPPTARGLDLAGRADAAPAC